MKLKSKPVSALTHIDIGSPASAPAIALQGRTVLKPGRAGGLVAR
nr:MAG TPA: hypothetical protein [Caudoviricetes sp.]